MPSARSALTTRALAGAYTGGDRAHVAIRLRLCPFGAIDALVPDTGQILDIACGHGHLALLLASGAPGRRVRGVDIDDRKIAAAADARDRLGIDAEQVSFSVVAADWLPAGLFDAVTIVDAAYLLGIDAAERLVRAAAQALAPGGVLLVKEMDMDRRAKAVVARSGELVMTRLAGITASAAGRIDFIAPARIEAWMQDEGLATTAERWDRGYPVPHHAVYGRRPAAQG